MFQRARNSAFAKNLATLLTGSAVAQLFPLILAPFVSRHFTASDVAVYGLYVSVVNIISSLANLKFEVTVLLPKEEGEARSLFRLSVLVAVACVPVLWLVQFFFGGYYGRAVENTAIVPWLQLVPVSVFFIGLSQAGSYWVLRQKKFSVNAIGKVAHRTVEAAFQLVSGLSNIGSGLVVADVVGRGSGAVYTVVKGKAPLGFLRWKEVVLLMRKYKEYPLHFTPSVLANSASANLPLMFISAAYSVEITGAFNFVRYVLSAPLGFVSQNLAQVLLERMSEKSRNAQPMMRDFMTLTKLMGGIALLLALPLMAVGHWLFGFVFGAEWEVAGQFARVLVLSFAVKFVVSPLSQVLVALGSIKAASVWQWSYFAASLCLLPLSLSGIGIYAFLFWFAAIETVIYIAYWLLIYWRVRRHDGAL